jgi:hypothetical protein
MDVVSARAHISASTSTIRPERNPVSLSRSILLPALVAASLFHALPGRAAAEQVTVVMDRLDNPRGLAFAPNGALFVAEAGHGAAPCPGTGLTCYGHTGAVSRYWKGRSDRVATGLPSIAFPAGAQARGPHDIAMKGLGNARVTIGLEADPATRETLGRPGLGWLVDIPASTLMAPSHNLRPDHWSFDVDIAAFEASNNPQPRIVESDPYAVLPAQSGFVVLDAGANALLDVDVHGEITLLATFPSRPDRTTDSVPTTVAMAPDGAYYVGEFTGFGAPLPPAGDAKIYRVVPGEAPTVLCTGFNRIIDMAIDDDGSLYVLQYFSGVSSGAGVLFHVVPSPLDAADRSCPERQRLIPQVVLDQPTAIALGRDGALYISNRGGRPAIGEVLRIEP